MWFRALNGWADMNFFTDEVYVFMARDLIYVVALLALVLLLFSSRPFFDKLKIMFLFLCIAVATYALIIFVIHPYWPRERPFEALLNVNQLIPETDTSFPSKHATFSFLLAGFAYGYGRRYAFWIFLGAIFIALGRVIVGVHYPLDVLSGAGLGVFIGLIASWIFKKMVK